MNIIAFRYLSTPSKVLPALIALALNAILFWGAVRATSVLPPERLSRMSAVPVNSSPHRKAFFGVLRPMSANKE